MEIVINFLQRVFPLPAGLEDHLRTILKYRRVRKREFIFKAGRICEHVCFIEKGLVRCFYIKNDQEVCSWFMKEGDVMFSVFSFYTQTASYEYIQAQEESCIYYITYTELMDIYRNFIEFNVHRGILTERYYLLSEQRSYSMRMHNACERYLYFRQQHPELIGRLPAKDIASYIGVSKSTMTRLRSLRL